MKILILGEGGREHALAWKLRQSPRVTEVYCAPCNGGISEIATCVPLPLAGQEALVAFAKEQAIDLTVVGPDDALAAGLVDRFEAEGLRIFGPVQAAARLESSKVFAKEFMQRHGIPTAASGHFTDSTLAQEFAARARNAAANASTGPAVRGPVSNSTFKRATGARVPSSGAPVPALVRMAKSGLPSAMKQPARPAASASVPWAGVARRSKIKWRAPNCEKSRSSASKRCTSSACNLPSRTYAILPGSSSE